MSPSQEEPTVEELRALLEEALDSVDADEQARRESWPGEIELGDLVLDLGDRIRRALGESWPK
ncbi:MAG: hypothetical protein M9921_14490 [Fimbriimonadaceae bacterium]|nr:hypothetical protein [Chthonomonadaceae bacterium]MCO5298053.1 hypothetical protein [Fimbriimonadaceae bacterium]